MHSIHNSGFIEDLTYLLIGITIVFTVDNCNDETDERCTSSADV